MPINPTTVKPGRVFITKTQQLRFVTQIAAGRVSYMTKSGKPDKVKTRWGYAATKANPPKVETFANAVENEVYLKLS
jgi:deoxyribose-phosphate aldolase